MRIRATPNEKAVMADAYAKLVDRLVVAVQLGRRWSYRDKRKYLAV